MKSFLFLGLSVLVVLPMGATPVATYTYYVGAVDGTTGLQQSFSQLSPVAITPGVNPSYSASAGQTSTSGFSMNLSNPSLTSSASLKPGVLLSLSSGGYTQSTGLLTYYFAVVAPAGGSAGGSVTVNATGTSTLSAGGFSLANSSASLASSVTATSSPSAVFECEVGDSSPDLSGCGAQTYQLSLAVPVLTQAQAASGTAFSGSVTIYDQAIAFGSLEQCNSNQFCQTPGSALATIDPFLQIDPAFLAANPGYQIEVSVGIGNGVPASSSAPEPRGLGLLGGAFAGVLGLRCLRKPAVVH